VTGAALAGVLTCLLGRALVVSPRIAGPAFAITRTCKQVADGNLTRPRPLRPRDLLLELGNEVMRMVDALRSRETQEREIALAAAAALRDPSAGAEARNKAADALEKIAREKGERIR